MFGIILAALLLTICERVENVWSAINVKSVKKSSKNVSI